MRQGFGHGGIPVAGQLWQQLVPDAIAGECGAGVGGVVAPGDAARAQIPLYLGAIDFDQRPDNAVAGDRADAGQPGAPGAAQETEEHGLGLIGAGMAGGDAVDGSGLRQTLEEFQADRARRLFEIVARFAA